MAVSRHDDTLDLGKLIHHLRGRNPGESLSTGRRYAFYPEPGGLFPWGMTETAYCFWLTDPDPECWTVVICGTSWQWHYPGGVTDLLPDLLSARITCPLFADDWPDPVEGIEVLRLPHT